MAWVLAVPHAQRTPNWVKSSRAGRRAAGPVLAFLRERVVTARKSASAGRDHALFRSTYHCGLRSDEAASLELSDLHVGGAVSVGFGSAPRPSCLSAWPLVQNHRP